MSSLVSGLNEAGKLLPTHVAAALATAEACKNLLVAAPPASALLTRSAYAAVMVWPCATEARHLDAVVGLDTQASYACYLCQSASLTPKGVHKPLDTGAGGGGDDGGGGGQDGGDGESEAAAAPPPASVPAVCVNTEFYHVSVQTLSRGNKTAYFPVALTRVPGPAA